MADARSKILRFSITTRLSIILLQLTCNTIMPDHSADAFKRPKDPQEQMLNIDKLCSFLFSGLTRWDSEYYLHIAHYGYTYENTLAFLPLYPMTIRVLAIMLKKILFFLNYESVLTMSAVLINFFCFVKSSLVFYDLSNFIMKKKIAYRSAILYCISPASIFFTAAYTESMFSYLTFYCMLASVKKNPFTTLPIGLSSLVRSNGLINVAFPLYICLQNLVSNSSVLFGRNYTKFSTIILGLSMILSSIPGIFKVILLSIAPFLLLQTYNYVLFCTESANSTYIPSHVEKYAVDNGLVMPGRGIPPWCNYQIPTAYSYIQKHYWNVGFMNYYEVKQIPNFILAFPVLFLMLKCIFEYLMQNWKKVSSLKVLTSDVDREDCKSTNYPAKMFPFIVHGLFLTFFCIFFVHIQVSTRLLASASPLLYWYSAILMSRGEPEGQEDKNDIHSRWKVFFMLKKRWTAEEKLVIGYFVGYTIVGTFMYSNFLPWT